MQQADSEAFCQLAAISTAHSSFRPLKNNGEHYWRWKLHKQTEPGTQLPTSWSDCVFLSVKHFSIHHRISGQWSDPYGSA